MLGPRLSQPPGLEPDPGVPDDHHHIHCPRADRANLHQYRAVGVGGVPGWLQRPYARGLELVCAVRQLVPAAAPALVCGPPCRHRVLCPRPGSAWPCTGHRDASAVYRRRVSTGTPLRKSCWIIRQRPLFAVPDWTTSRCHRPGPQRVRRTAGRSRARPARRAPALQSPCWPSTGCASPEPPSADLGEPWASTRTPDPGRMPPHKAGEVRHHPRFPPRTARAIDLAVGEHLRRTNLHGP